LAELQEKEEMKALGRPTDAPSFCKNKVLRWDVCVLHSKQTPEKEQLEHSSLLNAVV
jgi:hypothetical protein